MLRCACCNILDSEERDFVFMERSPTLINKCTNIFVRWKLSLFIPCQRSQVEPCQPHAISRDPEAFYNRNKKLAKAFVKVEKRASKLECQHHFFENKANKPKICEKTESNQNGDN